MPETAGNLQSQDADQTDRPYKLTSQDIEGSDAKSLAISRNAGNLGMARSSEGHDKQKDEDKVAVLDKVSERIIVHQPLSALPSAGAKFMRPDKIKQAEEPAVCERRSTGQVGQPSDLRDDGNCDDHSRPLGSVPFERTSPIRDLQELRICAAEAERLWQEQTSLEVSCDILQALTCIKAKSHSFHAIVAELQERVRLQEHAARKLDEICQELSRSDAMQQSPYRNKLIEERQLQKELQNEPMKQQEAEATLADREQMWLVQLEREARKLREQLMSKIRLQAKARAPKVLAEAEARRAAAEQLRRSAKASLEIRKSLQLPSEAKAEVRKGPKTGPPKAALPRGGHSSPFNPPRRNIEALHLRCS